VRTHLSILRTRRLDLTPASDETLQLLIAGEYGRASRTVGAVIAHGWRHEAEAVAGLAWHLRALRSDPSALLWRVRLTVLRAERRVIGSINLKGPPDGSGVIEIGWGISSAYRKRGIATEATRALIERALTQPNVRRVIATIPIDNGASQAVAARVGMVLTQETRRELPVWELRNEIAADDW
jgi:[ribosomal protein S5]-alanine N-acetyltransferase